MATAGQGKQLPHGHGSSTFPTHTAVHQALLQSSSKLLGKARQFEQDWRKSGETPAGRGERAEGAGVTTLSRSIEPRTANPSGNGHSLNYSAIKLIFFKLAIKVVFNS